jgi:hypothetical protein
MVQDRDSSRIAHDPVWVLSNGSPPSSVSAAPTSRRSSTATPGATFPDRGSIPVECSALSDQRGSPKKCDPRSRGVSPKRETWPCHSDATPLRPGALNRSNACSAGSPVSYRQTRWYAMWRLISRCCGTQGKRWRDADDRPFSSIIPTQSSHYIDVSTSVPVAVAFRLDFHPRLHERPRSIRM